MKFIPVMTEKSMRMAKNRAYTFLVPTSLNKLEIKSLIANAFGVEVVGVKTMTSKVRTKRNMRGKKVTIKATKKAIVSVKEGNKIELFDPTTPKKASRGKEKKAGDNK